MVLYMKKDYSVLLIQLTIIISCVAEKAWGRGYVTSITSHGTMICNSYSPVAMDLWQSVYAKVTGSPYYSSENVNLYYVYGR